MEEEGVGRSFDCKKTRFIHQLSLSLFLSLTLDKRCVGVREKKRGSKGREMILWSNHHNQKSLFYLSSSWLLLLQRKRERERSFPRRREGVIIQIQVQDFKERPVSFLSLSLDRHHRLQSSNAGQTERDTWERSRWWDFGRKGSQACFSCHSSVFSSLLYRLLILSSVSALQFMPEARRDFQQYMSILTVVRFHWHPKTDEKFCGMRGRKEGNWENHSQVSFTIILYDSVIHFSQETRIKWWTKSLLRLLLSFKSKGLWYKLSWQGKERWSMRNQ